MSSRKHLRFSINQGEKGSIFNREKNQSGGHKRRSGKNLLPVNTRSGARPLQATGPRGGCPQPGPGALPAPNGQTPPWGHGVLRTDALCPRRDSLRPLPATGAPAARLSLVCPERGTVPGPLELVVAAQTPSRAGGAAFGRPSVHRVLPGLPVRRYGPGCPRSMGWGWEQHPGDPAPW